MGSTVWHRQRKNAEAAGREDACSGEDRRAQFAEQGRDVAEAYDKGLRQQKADDEAAAAAFDHPLRQISRDANALWSRAESAEVSEVCRLIEAMADYLVEKEERT
jgi:hypothetical protein